MSGEARIEEWRDLRFGMFIHWGLYSMLARHEWIRHYEQISNEEYQKYFDLFYHCSLSQEQYYEIVKNSIGK